MRFSPLLSLIHISRPVLHRRGSQRTSAAAHGAGDKFRTPDGSGCTAYQSLPDKPCAVSYTHLDVYKRQGLSHLQRPAGVCRPDSKRRAGRIFEKYGWEPWVRRLKAKQKQGAPTRTHPEKSTYDRDMYNRAFPVGNALFLFAGSVMSLFRLPRGKLPLAFLAVPAGKDGWVECPCQTVNDFIGIRGSVCGLFLFKRKMCIRDRFSIKNYGSFTLKAVTLSRPESL